jgi:L-lactate dehydrogenase
VPVWSLANIAGMRLPEFCKAQNLPYDQKAMDEIFLQTRDAAYRIIERKGSTYYAVAAGLMRITQAILRDQSTVLSVSSLIHDYYGISDVYLSLPTVIDRRGVENVLRLELSPDEIEKLRLSAVTLKAVVEKLKL